MRTTPKLKRLSSRQEMRYLQSPHSLAKGVSTTEFPDIIQSRADVGNRRVQGSRK